MEASLAISSDISIFYIDSGPPTTQKVYTTIFALHGMFFDACVFDRLTPHILKSESRIVSIYRRGYGNSTPFSAEELSTSANGSVKERSELYRSLGHHIAFFIDAFIKKYNLPPPSPGGNGGIILLGWSLGATYALSAVSHADTLPDSVRSRVSRYIHTLILHEPASINLGLPNPPKTWIPALDNTIPENMRLMSSVQWVTAYFQHGDLSTRNPDLLSYIVPATPRIPTMFTMSEAERASSISIGPTAMDEGPLILNLLPQILTSFRKACFDEGIRALFSGMKVVHLSGEETAAFGPATLWQVEDENTRHGGGFIDCRFIPRANHLVHWDEPEKAVQIYLDCASR